MKRVVIESPFKATTERSQEQHKLYLIHAIADCVSRGEAPFASHILYTESLDDDDPVQRSIGIAAGYCWGEAADEIAVYRDLGISPGMSDAIKYYEGIGKPVSWRTLNDKIVRAILEMT